MTPEETIFIHRVTIGRFAKPGELPIYSATCRLCKFVIERKDFPLTITTPGPVAVRSVGDEILKFWRVPELPDSELATCTTEDVFSYSASALEKLFKRVAPCPVSPRISKHGVNSIKIKVTAQQHFSAHFSDSFIEPGVPTLS